MSTNDADSAPAVAQKVATAVGNVVQPTAPGTSTDQALPADLPRVLPHVGGSERLILWVGIGTGAAFIALAAAVGAHAVPVGTMDGSIHLWVITHRGPTVESIARAITWAGATMVALPLIAVIGALAQRAPASLFTRVSSGALLAGVASLGVYLGLIVNHAMGGQRPDQIDWAGDASGPTFPSGHTTMATIFAACCVWALAPRMANRAQLVALLLTAAAYAGLVGLTRIWLGVHWPSDVLGGWLFGMSWTALSASALIAARRRWPRVPLRHGRT